MSVGIDMGSQGVRLVAAGEDGSAVGWASVPVQSLPTAPGTHEQEPASFERTAHLAHQADVVVGHLTGDFAVTDYSNALKTGYDLVEERWPVWFARWPGVLERLPRVVAPGTVIGQVTWQAAAETGLPAGLPVAAGASDGTAGFLASGASKPGDYNTTLGTTLVFKGVSTALCGHPDGLIYCHKLPGGHWLPGGASNTGGEWIARDFAGEDLRSLDAAAACRLPVSVLAYPNLREGERFPFLNTEARGFSVPEPMDRVERFAANLQGAALLERLGYDVLDGIAGASGGDVYSTGGGSRSDVWMQLRADVTGRALHRPACPESAFGSAVLAAAERFGGVPQAIAALVRREATFAPDPAKVEQYNEIYARFCEELRRRGYLSA